MRVKLAVILLEVLYHVASATAQPKSGQPVPLIDGPTAARVGDLIILDASSSKADHFDWLIDTSGVSLPDDGETARRKAEELRRLGFKVEAPESADGTRTHVILDEGKRLVLASYPGTWRISLAVANGDGVKQLPWKIVVTGDVPRPPPDPGPGPGPDPGPPPIKVDFSEDARRWLATVPVSSQDMKDDRGHTVRQNLSETLNEIGISWKQAGSIKAMETLLGVGIQASLRPLGAKAKDWSSFANSANTALDGLKNKDATPEQYGAALVSIAKGLE